MARANGRGAQPSTQNNLTYCYLATGVERLGEQHLDATEDIRVHLFSGAEVRELLESGRIRQALMAAPCGVTPRSTAFSPEEDGRRYGRTTLFAGWSPAG